MNYGLGYSHPHLREEWNGRKNMIAGISFNSVTYGSQKKAWWRCKICRMEWQATVTSRTNGTGCPYCSGKKTCENNCLANNDPNRICEDWDYIKNSPLLPYDVMPKSSKKVWWKCRTCKKEWQETINNRANGAECPFCFNSNISEDDCLANNDSYGICEEWHHDKNGSFNPFNISPKSLRKVWWICNNCDKEWQATINDRSNGLTCKNCEND